MTDSTPVVVLGAGALGRFVAGRLALAGVSVRLQCKAHQAAELTRRGVVLREGGQVRRVSVPVEIGPTREPVDIALLALKSHDLAEAGDQVRALVRRGATLVALSNGIPWWMSAVRGGVISSVDPHGHLRAATRGAAVIGGVVYWAVHRTLAGLRVNGRHGRILLGTPDPTSAGRLEPVMSTLAHADLGLAPTADIRSAVWDKLWVWSPVSLACARSGLTVGQALSHGQIKADIIAMAGEIHAVATLNGARLHDDITHRLAVFDRDAIHGHVPSLARDVRSARSPELSSMVDAVIEAGDLGGCPLPNMRRYRRALDTAPAAEGHRTTTAEGQHRVE